MAPARSMQPPIDVVFLSASTVPAVELDLTALEAALGAQGVTAARTTVITAEDPLTAGLRLAAALRGPARAGTETLEVSDVVPAVAVLDADIIVNAPPLGAVLDDPRMRTGALAVSQKPQQPRQSPPGQAAGPAIQGGAHTDRELFLGVLRVDGADRATAAGLARSLPTGSPEPLLDLTRALTAAGVPVQPVQLGGYGWARTTRTTRTTISGPTGRSTPGQPSAAEPGSRATLEAQIDGLDERTVRLREAARGGDGFYSTFVLRRMSWRLTEVAERTGLTPNQVTVISFGLGLLAAVLLSLGGRGWAVAGALLLQICLLVDCVDGELARYRRRFSRFGAWLDATTDRVKEFAAVAGLAVGAAAGGRHHGAHLWGLVAAAIAVQTFRNLLDLGWALQRSASGPAPVAPVEWLPAPTGLRVAGAVPGGPGAGSWVRRVGHFPIGERFLLISLGAAFWTPRGTLIALLVAGLLSAAYMLAAFAVRSSSSGAPGRRISALADSGPLLGAAIRRAGGDRAGRLTAMLPALVAVAELGLVWWLAAGVADARGPAVVLLVAVIAIAHYQHAYGVREENEGSAGLVLGTDLRLLILLLVVVLPAGLLSVPDNRHWATASVLGLAALVATASTLRSLQVWTNPSGRSRHAGRTTIATEDTQLPVQHEAIGGVR